MTGVESPLSWTTEKRDHSLEMKCSLLPNPLFSLVIQDPCVHQMFSHCPLCPDPPGNALRTRGRLVGDGRVALRDALWSRTLRGGEWRWPLWGHPEWWSGLPYLAPWRCHRDPEICKCALPSQFQPMVNQLAVHASLGPSSTSHWWATSANCRICFNLQKKRTRVSSVVQ